jgi:hypothetical protein
MTTVRGLRDGALSDAPLIDQPHVRSPLAGGLSMSDHFASLDRQTEGTKSETEEARVVAERVLDELRRVPGRAPPFRWSQRNSPVTQAVASRETRHQPGGSSRLSRFSLRPEDILETRLMHWPEP